MTDRTKTSSAGAADRHAAAGVPRVCIVTSEIEGPFFNGGVGSTNRGLALTLRRLGCSVDILYTQVAEGQPVCLRGTFAGHVADYARQGVRLLAIANRSGRDDWAARSWLVLQHLLTERYQAVFFDDLFGSGYYALLARRTGCPALAGTAMVVTAHGALEWVSEQDEAAVLNFAGLPLFEMERRSLELADVVKAPSRYILGKYQGYGWTLPARTVVMPNFVSDRDSRLVDRPGGPVPVQEIVFFGRLETRKGIWLFLRALDRIKYRLAGRTVTFLGKSLSTGPEILRHALGWPFPIRLLTQYNQDQALAYLRGAGRLAVMPSPEDNSPSTVLECLDQGIAFLAASGSGAEELIDPACHGACLFAPSVDALADKLLETLDAGGRPARHAFDAADLSASFAGLLQQVLQMPPRAVDPPEPPSGPRAILALVPSGLPADATAAHVRAVEDRLGAGTIVHLLAEQPQALRDLLQGSGAIVHAHDRLAEAAAQLAAQRPCAVAFCQADALPGPDWFDRAALCFAQGLAAVTGMAPALAAEPVLREPVEPWFSPAQPAPVARFLIGPSPALSPLVLASNSGFAMLAAGALDILGSLDSFDPHRGRLQPPAAILHELLAALHASGGRFELVPDLPAPAARQDPLANPASEAVALRAAARRLAEPGDALWAVHRLAVDSGIDRIRRDESAAWRAALTQRMGFAVEAVTPALPRERQLTDLARMAAATGQTELAVELMANLHPFADHLQADQLGAFIRAEAAAIHLVERHRKGAFSGVNLMHDYSVVALSDTELQLHANAVSEPRAAIAFSGLDLAGLGAFSAKAVLPNPQARAVRLRVDILAEDGAGHLAIERALLPGQTQSLHVEVPPDLRVTCRVIVGVEMADPQAPHDHAYLRLVDPRFVPATPEGTP